MKPSRISGFLGEVIRFGGVGTMATLTHYASALLLSRGLDIDPAWAALLGVNVSALVSYFGHGHVTFRRRLDHRSMLPRFIASILSSYGLSYLGTHALVALGSIPDFIVFGIVVLAIVGFNFMLFRFWVFR